MVTEKDHLTEALDLALQSVVCFCSNYKRIGNPFCFQCFDSLPANQKTILQRAFLAQPMVPLPIHQYDAARQWLIKHYPQRLPANFDALSQCLDKTR